MEADSAPTALNLSIHTQQAQIGNDIETTSTEASTMLGK